MKPDGRNLTPTRALPLLRGLDAARHHLIAASGPDNGARYAFDAVREALDAHIRLGLAKKRRPRRG